MPENHATTRDYNDCSVLYAPGMRVVGYVRVSSQEQVASGAGLAAQRQAIQAEGDRRGWSIRWTEDPGYSAKDLKRPGIQTALGMLRAGEADALVVAKLDRLSRSVIDFATLLKEATAPGGWQLVILDLGVDTTTPTGRLVAGVVAQVAEFEREMIRERTRVALAAKRAAGARLGPPAVPAAVRERIARARSGGATLQAIATELNRAAVPTAQGGRCWYPSTIAAVLRSA